jgi:glutamine amidotransferase
VKGWIAAGRPLLGICLGMQLLFEGSEEDAPAGGPHVPGLAVLPGKVVRFREEDATPRLKVPHMGWNTLSWRRDDPLLRGLPQQSAVYFVHSYYAQPADAALTSASADYGRPFCATVWRGNLWATQFHPEKSQRVGLAMLANFAALPSST